MLLDCFGFPASLPSILAHPGVKGLSTQKLSSAWRPVPRVGGPDSPEQTPDGIPFNVGIWEGTRGKTVIAPLNPDSYTSTIHSDLSKSPAAARRTGPSASTSTASAPASTPTTTTAAPATSVAPWMKNP